MAGAHDRGSKGRIGAEFWLVAGRYRWRIAAAVVLLLAAKLATVAVPLLLKRIIDALSGAALPASLPLYLLVGYALLRFSSTLFNEWRDLLFVRVTLEAVAAYARKTFEHLHALGPRFHARRKLGSLLPDIDRGTGGIAFLLGVGLFTIVPTLVEIALVLGIMLSRYPAGFAGVILVTFLLYAGFTLVFTARRVVYQRRVNKLDSNAKGRLADSLIDYDTVKFFNNEALEAERFGAILRDWRAAGAANQREMSVGDLVLINAFALQVCLPLDALGFVYREARDAWVNTERLFELLREQPEIVDALGSPLLRTGPGEVVFEHVSFHYEPARPVLVDVSLRIARGTTLAVVGCSGSGKSTLARLLLRYYDPSSGRILVDGQDIREVAAGSVRQAIGVVPQETALFNDTLGNNIAYGRMGGTPGEVVQASRAAQLHELIESLPGKYDTQVGERGVNLSGGARSSASPSPAPC